MKNIIQRNFFRLLRSGAFDDKSSIEPMSPFKWRRLYQMVEAQNVVTFFSRGANNHQHDEGLNLPADLVETVSKAIAEHPRPATTNARMTIPEAELSSSLFNRRLHKLIDGELHSMDTSIEAIELLKIIVFNVSAMLNRGMSLDGIIRLGQYLRTRGDKVDFVKVENWLQRLHLDRMAELQGNILISVFGFDEDELPFVHREDNNAYKLTLRTVSHLAKDTAEVWHFRQGRAGFVQNNSRILRRNMRRSVRYFTYAPIETTSNFFSNLGKSLSEIEE